MQTNSLLQPCIDTESAVREIHRKELSEYKKNTRVRSNRNYCPADVLIHCRLPRPGSWANAPACSVCTVSVKNLCSAKRFHNLVKKIYS